MKPSFVILGLECYFGNKNLDWCHFGHFLYNYILNLLTY